LTQFEDIAAAARLQLDAGAVGRLDAASAWQGSAP
jgi:hypothetical protein